MSLKAAATVLVVDDTPSNLQVLFAYLESAGFKVLLAQNAQRALQIIDSLIPDLILLDILMPDIDGFELCSLLKNRASTQEIPIIFLTALSETTHKIKGFAIGGVDYITKPIEQQEVIARIKTHLTLKNIQQDLQTQNQQLEKEIKIRQQVELQLQQALKYEATIRTITERIRDSLDEKQVLQTVTQELVKSLNLDGCQIEFYSSDRNKTMIVTEQNKTGNLTRGAIKQVADYPQIYRQLAQKKSLQLVTNLPLKANSELKILPKRSNVNIKPHGCLICPIFDYQEPINLMGNLWLLRPPSELFTTAEITLAEQIANQCAIAIRQARLYQTSQIQIEELAKLNRLKDDFLKTISHELRSPMSSIQLAVQTLEKLVIAEYSNPKSDTFKKVLEIFRQSCERQKQLIDDLLTLCHLDAQAETIITDFIDLQTWIPEIIKPFQEQIRNQQQQLIVKFPPDIPQLKSDPFILERIIRELINNACKYTPARETISIAIQTKPKTVHLIINNSGIEIPSEERARIFDRFYRIPNNDPWQYGGTGLGLYLVKRLLELIKGKIFVTSHTGTTQFVLELPYSF